MNLEEIKNHFAEVYDSFADAAEDNKKVIDSFTGENFNDLLGIIYADCQTLTLLQTNEEEFSNSIRDNKAKEMDLYELRDRTLKEIIDENLINMYLIFNGTVIGTWISSNDPIEFIKRFINIMIIAVGTFYINARYYESDARKKKMNRKILRVRDDIQIGNYQVEEFKKYENIIQQEIVYATNKLLKIAPSKLENESFDEYFKRIFPSWLQIVFEENDVMNNETQASDTIDQVKTKVRKK